jgi:hypothetical protein
MGHLKLKDGTNFPLNLSVGDIRDISKRSGAFSKTVTLVGDDENNDLLNHYYDVNIVAGTFDINKLQQCQIIQNGIVILDNAYMQLVEVVKKQSNDSHNQQIEYKVLVKDSVSDFFTKLGNKTLNDINMEEIVNGGTPITYTSANVTGSFNNTITDGYKFVVPIDDDNAYNLRAFHPAMYAKTYFDSIFQRAGFTYEWGNQSPNVHTTNDNYFEKLLIPYNGGLPKIDRSNYLVEATYATGTGTPFGTGLQWEQQVTGFTEVTDGENIFDPTNGDYAVPLWLQNPQNVEVRVTLDYDLDIVNNDASLSTRSGGNTVLLYSKILEQGSTTNFDQALINTATLPNTIAASTTTNLITGGTITLTMNLANLTDTDIMELYFKTLTPSVTYNTSVDIDLTINSSSWEIIPNSESVTYNSDLDLNIYIPKKVKQSDFIKSIFQMYNLYAEVDKSQPNKIILQHRDDYYDSGAEIDWTEKLAKDKDQTLQFLPELSTKKMVLSYKDDKDDVNEIYKEATNETYGQIEYTFENEYVKGIDRKEIIFSPTPTVKSPFNAYLPALSYIPETNIRILVDGGTQTCNDFFIYEYYVGNVGYANGSPAVAQNTAPLITHFDDPLTPSFDLNFATCDYYFYSDLSQKTNNNLYNLYWRRTLGQIDKGKMLTAFFFLEEIDIQGLNLNDKIRIDNSWWHINRVIDYDANIKKLTKVELISIDEEVEFTPFATTPSVPAPPTSSSNPEPIKETAPEANRPIKDILTKNSQAKNMSKGNTLIMGRNNVVTSDVKNALIVGDNQTAEEDGIHTNKFYINGDEIAGNLATSDITQTEDRRIYTLYGNTSSEYVEFVNSDANGVMRVKGDGILVDNDNQGFELVTGGTTARATTATDGFLYIPTCAGTPTGTPTGQAGNVPLIYDDTNQVLYIYSGGAWSAH